MFLPADTAVGWSFSHKVLCYPDCIQQDENSRWRQACAATDKGWRPRRSLLTPGQERCRSRRSRERSPHAAARCRDAGSWCGMRDSIPEVLIVAARPSRPSCAPTAIAPGGASTSLTLHYPGRHAVDLTSSSGSCTRRANARRRWAPLSAKLFEESGLIPVLLRRRAEEGLRRALEGLDQGLAPRSIRSTDRARAVTPPGRLRRFNRALLHGKGPPRTRAADPAFERDGRHPLGQAHEARVTLPTITGLDLGRDRSPGSLAQRAAGSHDAAQDPALHHGAPQAPDDRGEAGGRAARESSSPADPAAGHVQPGPFAAKLGVRLRNLVLIRWGAVTPALHGSDRIGALASRCRSSRFAGRSRCRPCSTFMVSLGRGRLARIDDREAIFLAFDNAACRASCT